MNTEHHHLDLAARLALRAMGHAEPNPLVGAVLVKDNRVIGLGHHRRYGQLHAEREALESARRQGHDPRGSTIYVTLEPCRHHGKQPPCTDALIAAGVSRVVYARPDPNPLSRGGADILRAAGIRAEHSAASPFAAAVALPFIKSITSDLPFVLAKWAQTSDGRLITRPDEPRWISGPVARRRVHALRGRVDVVLTGVGTILADDPRLTPRDVKPRRTARRVILDSHLRTPPTAAIFADVKSFPVLILTTEAASRSPAAAPLRAAGAEIVHAPTTSSVPRLAVLAQTVPPIGSVDLCAALRILRSRFAAHTVMVEAGPTLLASLFDHHLIDAAVVHAALAPGSRPSAPPAIASPRPFTTNLVLAHTRPIGIDSEQIFLAR